MLLVVFNNLCIRNSFHNILRRRNARQEFGHREDKGNEHLLITKIVMVTFNI